MSHRCLPKGVLTIRITYVILMPCLDYKRNPDVTQERFMARRLTNKIVLITGGSSGIGLATARLFLAEGARVAITGRNQQTLDAAKAALGDGVLTIQADATDIEATTRAVT